MSPTESSVGVRCVKDGTRAPFRSRSSIASVSSWFQVDPVSVSHRVNVQLSSGMEVVPNWTAAKPAIEKQFSRSSERSSNKDLVTLVFDEIRTLRCAD